jgi:hypothetical protein
MALRYRRRAKPNAVRRWRRVAAGSRPPSWTREHASNSGFFLGRLAAWKLLFAPSENRVTISEFPFGTVLSGPPAWQDVGCLPCDPASYERAGVPAAKDNVSP